MTQPFGSWTRGSAVLVIDCALDQVENRSAATPLTFSAAPVLELLTTCAATLARDYGMTTADVLRQMRDEVQAR